MRRRILFLVSILCVFALPALAQEGGEDTPEPQRSYLICDWGLLTIEKSTEQPEIFINIESPTDYSGVMDSIFTLAGTGAGLFEGNVIVQISLQGGDVVFEGTTVLQSEEFGDAGDWSIDVDGDIAHLSRHHNNATSHCQ